MQVGRVEREYVVGKHDHVRELADIEGPDPVVGEARDRRALGVADQSFLERQTLLRDPTTGVFAVERPPRDRRVDPEERIERRDPSARPGYFFLL